MSLERSDRACFRMLLAAIFVCIYSSCTIANAQDGGPIIIGQREKLKAFELESLHVSIEAYWRSRLNDSTDTLGVNTKTTENIFRETLTIGGEGFIGDPNLLKLDLSLSLRLAQEDIDSSDSVDSNRTSESVSEYDVSAVFLQRSDTPLTLYSRRSQVLLSRQFADSLDSISTEHGARFLLDADFMSNQFQVFHREHLQTGRFTGTDSDIVQDSFAWQGRVKPVGGHRFWWDYTFSNIDESGQILTANNFIRHDAFVNHTYDFGTTSQNSIRSSLRLFQETGNFPVDRVRLDETLRLEHSKNFETKYTYMFDQQTRRLSKQTNHRGVASFRHELFDSLTTTGQIGSSIFMLSDGDFESKQYFFNFGAKYQKIVPHGLLNAAVNMNYNHQDDGERGSSIFITDESHTFGASGFVVLSRRNVVSSSIIVTDQAGIITYLEGADYTLRILGDSIEISRVLGGSIAAGQTVLITYEIGPEPENTTDTLGFGMTVRYRIVDGPLKGLSPYLRYRDQSQDRSTIGIVPFTGNSFNDFILGVDYDFGKISMTAEHQIHDSTLSPFNSTRLEGRYTNRISNRSAVSITAYYLNTDRTQEDVQTQIANLTARWTARHGEKLRSTLTGTYRREEDSRGSNSDAYEAAFDLNWRHRQTLIYCSLRHSFLTGDSRESTSQTFTFGAKREF